MNRLVSGAGWSRPTDDDPGPVDADGVHGDRCPAENQQGGVPCSDSDGITQRHTLGLTHLKRAEPSARRTDRGGKRRLCAGATSQITEERRVDL